MIEKIKNNRIIKRLLILLGSIAFLYIGFHVLAYVLLERMGYYTPDFVRLVMIITLVVIIIAALCDWQKIVICPSIGYNLGYILGFIFNTEYIGDGGTRMNTWWQWLISVILISICVGIVWEIISYVKRNKSNANYKN
ncbi:MAG: hypothetical protein IKC39_04005 [Clostridia bacterium]|nr:hypothetical protein [Clostridia bacterium]MBR6754930.1 hypothetical protein [Clostridia bacterium]